MSVKELMAEGPVVTIGPEKTLADAADLMKRHRIGGVPVVDDEGKLIGIVTVGDLAHEAQEGVGPAELLSPEWSPAATTRPRRLRLEEIRVEDAMAREVVTVGRESSCRDAARTLLGASVHRAVVVDAERRPVGMLSSQDFVRYVAGRPSTEPS